VGSLGLQPRPSSHALTPPLLSVGRSRCGSGSASSGASGTRSASTNTSSPSSQSPETESDLASSQPSDTHLDLPTPRASSSTQLPPPAGSNKCVSFAAEASLEKEGRFILG
jgi:hypothetical protein